MFCSQNALKSLEKEVILSWKSPENHSRISLRTLHKAVACWRAVETFVHVCASWVSDKLLLWWNSHVLVFVNQTMLCHVVDVLASNIMVCVCWSKPGSVLCTVYG